MQDEGEPASRAGGPPAPAGLPEEPSPNAAAAAEAAPPPTAPSPPDVDATAAPLPPTLEASESSAGGLISASGSLLGMIGGLSSRQHSSVSRSQLGTARSLASPSLLGPTEAADDDGVGAAAEEAVPEEPEAEEELAADDGAAPAQPPVSTHGTAAALPPADSTLGGANSQPAGSTHAAAAFPPADSTPVGADSQLAGGTHAAVAFLPEGSTHDGANSQPAGSPSTQSESLVSEGSGDSPSSSSIPASVSSPPRLSVWQLMQAREREQQAAGAAGASPPSGSASARSPRRGMQASPSQGRLACCRSSPAVGRRQRTPAATASPSGSSVGSLGPSGSGYASTLLRPTSSYIAAVEDVQSRKARLRQGSLPSAYQPKATEQKHFHLLCDERSQTDYTRVNEAALLTREERDAQEAEKGRAELARELKGARERCRRTLTTAPPRHSPPAREASPPQFCEFKLRSVERHAAYAQSFSAKVAEQQRQEDELHCSSGSRSPSRIGALHGPAGASPPQLVTEQRAARHSMRSAERRRREEEAAAAQEAERLAQLTAQERAEEEERRQHRFKARKMPALSVPVFSPDNSKVKPPTVPVEFKFSARFGSPSAGGSGSSSRSISRLRNEGSGASI